MKFTARQRLDKNVSASTEHAHNRTAHGGVFYRISSSTRLLLSSNVMPYFKRRQMLLDCDGLQKYTTTMLQNASSILLFCSGLWWTVSRQPEWARAFSVKAVKIIPLLETATKQQAVKMKQLFAHSSSYA
jgi:hypothetical protein